MNYNYPFRCFLLLLLPVLWQCHHAPVFQNDTVKHHPNDPFKNGMVKSEFFEIGTDSTAIVESADGIRIVFPQNCLVDKSGKPVHCSAKIEIAAALDFTTMALSNLMPVSDGKQLITDGMMFWNATCDGTQLGVDPDNPVYIEIPTPDKLPGMQIWRGTRDENGNMNWTDPQPTEDFLTAVDIFTLDFLPNGFAAAVEQNMPFGAYTVATKELTDSLYFSLSGGVFQLTGSDFTETNLNEPYYNIQREVVNGAYTKASYRADRAFGDTVIQQESPRHSPEIDPAMIKAIQSEKFQNTLIATREFEQRLQTIFKTCNNAVLEVYVKNLDKNLWELDEMAAAEAEKGGELNAAKRLREYAAFKLTKVKNDGIHAKALARYFKKQLKSIRNDLKNKKKQLRQALNSKSEAARQLAQEYRELLWQREKHRMQTYGFQWSQTGWINVDIGTEPKDWGMERLEVTVENSREYERVYVYAGLDRLGSIYRLNTEDGQHFFAGNSVQKSMLLPRESIGLYVIGYQNGEPAGIGTNYFIPGEDTVRLVSIYPYSKEAIGRFWGKFSEYAVGNSVEQDLAFMEKFDVENKRQAQLRSQANVMYRLAFIAFPCRSASGEMLFIKHCASCHNINMKQKLTGPALAGVQTAWGDDKTLYAWIRNSQRMIESGHPRAVELWNMWKPTLMNNFEQLSDEDIADILLFINNQS